MTKDTESHAYDFRKHLGRPARAKESKKKAPKAQTASSKKVERAMHEMKRGELHSGSKKGPVVTDRAQAIAIGLSEARRGKK